MAALRVARPVGPRRQALALGLPLTGFCNQVDGVHAWLVAPGVEVEGDGEGLTPPHQRPPAADLGRVVLLVVAGALPVDERQLQA